MALQSRPPMLHENRKSQIAQLMRESRGPAVRAPAPGPKRMIGESKPPEPERGFGVNLSDGRRLFGACRGTPIFAFKAEAV